MPSTNVISRIALALTLLGVLAGCAADCVNVCEDRKDCPGASPDERTRDCERACDDQTTTAKDFGCTSQYSDLVDCLAKLDDLCDAAPSACSAEQTRVYQCRQVYCADHPDAAGCGW